MEDDESKEPILLGTAVYDYMCIHVHACMSTAEFVNRLKYIAIYVLMHACMMHCMVHVYLQVATITAT